MTGCCVKIHQMQEVRGLGSMWAQEVRTPGRYLSLWGHGSETQNQQHTARGETDAENEKKQKETAKGKADFRADFDTDPFIGNDVFIYFPLFPKAFFSSYGD